MLLLDEPTNHLDAESVDWLEQFLSRFPGTVVAVTHDRYFLDNAAEWILELDRGMGIPWKGNYSSWLEQKEERLEREAKSEVARIKTMKNELEWVRQNAKGRQAKSKARLKRFDELSSYEYQTRNETQEIFIPVAERLGNQVIEFKNVSKGYGDRLLIDSLSFSVPPGAIVGVIGPNGAGKSTLFHMVTGQEKPDSGEIVMGPSVQIAAVEQTRESLPNDKSVWEAISGGLDILQVGRFEMPSRAYLGRFNFKGGDQQKIVGNLSGGERGRLHLAATLLKGGNVLLLDEPSNDLDVETLRALEEALLEFAGSVLVISHDRWFLDRIATHILAAEGDSQWTFFNGNYQEYEADKKKRLGEEGAAPHRLRFKPLTRSLTSPDVVASARRSCRPCRCCRSFQVWPGIRQAKRNVPGCVELPDDLGRTSGRTCAMNGSSCSISRKALHQLGMFASSSLSVPITSSCITLPRFTARPRVRAARCLPCALSHGDVIGV